MSSLSREVSICKALWCRQTRISHSVSFVFILLQPPISTGKPYRHHFLPPRPYSIATAGVCSTNMACVHPYSLVTVQDQLWNILNIIPTCLLFVSPWYLVSHQFNSLGTSVLFWLYFQPLQLGPLLSDLSLCTYCIRDALSVFYQDPCQRLSHWYPRWPLHHRFPCCLVYWALTVYLLLVSLLSTLSSVSLPILSMLTHVTYHIYYLY